MSELNGNWIAHIQFLQGEARHAVWLEQPGEELKGGTARSSASRRCGARIRGS